MKLSWKISLRNISATFARFLWCKCGLFRICLNFYKCKNSIYDVQKCGAGENIASAESRDEIKSFN